jgi:glycogen debranching enzyme
VPLAQARRVLRACAGPAGFVASPADDHYGAVWTRDAAFASLGSDLLGDDELLGATRRTLLTMAEHQSELGQVPNAYWPADDHWDWGEAGCTDASALFVVGACHHLRRTGDAALRDRLLPHLQRAHDWLRHQDANNVELIDSPLAGDWMDSTLARSGKVLYVNVLYFWATKLLAELRPELAGLAQRLHRKVNLLFWPERDADYADLLGRGRFPHVASQAAWAAAARPDRWHYLSSVQFGRCVDACDTLANCLAVLSGIATGQRARRIMEGLVDGPAVAPFPARSWTEPRAPDPEAERFQAERWRNPPFRYHNAAVWPFVGGYLVAALAHAGMAGEAARQLDRLARANELGEWGFHEWIDARTGAPGGARNQCWSAGAFALAASAVGRRLPRMDEDPRRRQAEERDAEDRELFALQREEREAERTADELEHELEQADKRGEEARKLGEQEIAHERGTDHRREPLDGPP